jgi:hypothetical protein
MNSMPPETLNIPLLQKKLIPVWRKMTGNIRNMSKMSTPKIRVNIRMMGIMTEITAVFVGLVFLTEDFFTIPFSLPTWAGVGVEAGDLTWGGAWEAGALVWDMVGVV